MALSKIDLANMVENDLAAGSQPLTIIENKINFRNIIINGDMSIAQRSTSVSGLTNGSNGYHTIDRYRFSELTSPSFVFTQSQSTTVPSGQGFATSLKMDCTTADTSLAAGDGLRIQQRLEGQNLQYLKKGTSSAESLTLSFWVRSSKTGTYICELFDNDNTRYISQSYTISSADTWEKKTLTYAGDTTGTLGNDNAESLTLNFWLASGTTYSSGTLGTSWHTTAANRAVGQVNLGDSTSNEWYVTGVQLEAGTSASDFEFLPVDVNLNRCLRYYQKSYSLGTSPGTNTTNGLHTTDGSAGGLTTGYLYGDIDLKVAMRATPTVTIYDKAGNSGVCARLNGGTSRTDNQNCSVIDTIEKGFNLESTGTANAGSIDIHFEAAAEL